MPSRAGGYAQRRRVSGIEAPVPTTQPLGFPAFPDRSHRAAGSAQFRVLSRVVALIAASLVAGAFCAAALALGRVAPPAGLMMRRAVARRWARSVARILGMRVRIEGAAPAAPCLLVANHLGYVDVVAFWCATGGSFVAKSEVASWPLVGALGRIAQTLFIDRGRKRDVVRVIAAMEQTLGRGESVIVFAEGTSTGGDRVLRFRSSLFEAARRSGVPVRTASISYATPRGAPSADRAVCWWGDMTFADHAFALMKLRGFDATLRFAAEPIEGGDRKEMARRAHAAVRASWSQSKPSERA